jgi:hypothetical protein
VALHTLEFFNNKFDIFTEWKKEASLK